MFSALGHIFLNQPRHAESTDARQGINRHDPDQEQRRKKEDGGNAATDADDFDNAVVSTEALRVFLENFLKSMPQEQQNDLPGLSAAQAVPEKTPFIPVQNAQAISAYQATARTAAPVAAPTDSSAAVLKLEAHEMRSIYKLLEDLKILAALKIEYLHIERSDTFIHSLEAAVAKALSQPR